MKKNILFLFAIASLTCCRYFKKEETKTSLNDKLGMMEADRAFSQMSEEKGMKTAFLEYIDSNGVLLRSGHLPMVGADAVDYLIQQNDTGFTLKWEPRHAEMAKSGDLGYTYGIYALTPNNQDTIIYGTYVSIWRKEAGGEWKYVLDTGNEGIGELR